MDSQKQSAEKLILRVLLPINFLLSLLIVFHHAFMVDINYIGTFDLFAYGGSIAFQRYMYNLSECAVPVFFFISAFLFYRTFDGTWANYKEKMRHRVKSLLIPYLIFCTLGYFKAQVFNGGLGGGNSFDCVISLWECNTMPLWFIRELMALSLLAPVFWQILKRPMVAIALCLLLLIMTCFGYVPYRSFVYWVPVYLLGATCNMSIWNKFVDLFAHRTFRIFSTILILAYFISAWYLPNGIPREEMTLIENTSFALFRFVTPIIWIAIMWWILMAGLKEREFMRYSFFVYCMHAPVIAFVRLAYEKTVPVALQSDTTKYLLIVFSTYVICVAVAMLLKRYTPAVWQILNGGRK